jgi:hypothetical protein
MKNAISVVTNGVNPVHPSLSTAVSSPSARTLRKLRRKVIARNAAYQRTLGTTSTQPQLGWAGGFIDGDGCISIVKTRFNSNKTQYKISYGLLITITQNDRHVLEHLRDIIKINGSITDTPLHPGHKRSCYALTYSGAYAYSVMKLLQPYFYRKQQECQLAILFQRHKMSLKKHGRRLTCPTNRKYLESLYLGMKSFK